MKQLNDYSQLIKEALSGCVHLANKRPNLDCDVVTVFDDTSQRYLVLEVGWENNKRVQNLILHVALHNGKIWY